MLCHFHICTEITVLRSGGIRQMAWANYLFKGLGDKIGQMSHLALSTNIEIEERINTSASSYTIESNEDTFNSDMVFESFVYNQDPYFK